MIPIKIQSAFIFSGTKQVIEISYGRIKKQEYRRKPWQTKHNDEVGGKPTRY